jgi:hypothetical protein
VFGAGRGGFSAVVVCSFGHCIKRFERKIGYDGGVRWTASILNWTNFRLRTRPRSSHGFPPFETRKRSFPQIIRWPKSIGGKQAHLDEDEMRNAVKAAKENYEDALRAKFFGF